ncbi:MAG TPA: hypothetical protein VFA47_02790 [Candidatus Manganitrophaceae bacterium]|nr:hypothetical protein [Candidatus Manganitrophaceae bacterium]
MRRTIQSRPVLVAIALLFSGLFLTGGPVYASGTSHKSEKDQERLLGRVKTVLIEFSKVSDQGGKWVEGPRTPWLSTTYDRQGNRIQEDQLYQDVELNFKSVFTYDPPGQIKEGVEYDYQGKPTFKWSYTHDPGNKVIEESRYEPNGVLFSKSSYHYDADGNLVEEERVHSHSANDLKWVYLYDEAGRKVEESFYVVRAQGLLNTAESTLDSKQVYSYDAKGTLLEETRYDAAGTVKSKKSYRYEYDAAGNWIKQIAREWVNHADKTYFEPTEVTYRTITYYP